MKILFTPLSDRYNGIISSVKRVFEDVKVWDTSKPMFDFFDENDADIIFCDNSAINENFLEATKHLGCKFVVFGDMVPLEMECSLVCSSPSASPVMKKNLEQSYNVLYIHDFVDVENDIGGEFREELKSDVGFVCKSEQFNLEDFKLLLKLASSNQFKIIGSGVAMPQYLGIADKKTELDFMKSISIGIDIKGKNLLEMAANGIFCLCDIPNSLFPTITLDNYQPAIDTYLNEPEQRKEIALKAKEQVLGVATSYHVLQNIINKLEIPGDSYYHCINKITQELQ